MESVLDELKQATAVENIANVVKAIERSEKLQMSSEALAAGRQYLRSSLSRRLQEFKTPARLVQQVMIIENLFEENYYFVQSAHRIVSLILMPLADWCL